LRTKQRLQVIKVCALFAFLFLFASCRQDMADEQPKYTPLEASTFFEDGKSARLPVDGTVARGQLKEDAHLYTGKIDKKDVDTFPFPVTKEVLMRGQERYKIACSHCHDLLGTGNGMIVQRGFRRPPAFQIDRLRQAPVGHFFDVITNGFGAMPSHAYEVAVRDRWAIASYIRVLQATQPAAPGAATSEPEAVIPPGQEGLRGLGQPPTENQSQPQDQNKQGGQQTKPAPAGQNQKPKTGEQQ
jgi:hypothetical protein